MGFFFRKEKSKTFQSLVRTSLATELRIKETLGMRQLDSMPLQAARAFQLAGDPRATISDFVRVIESDEALSARIIRVANSVYFRRGEEAKDIEKAVAAVGLNELRCLISATMLRSLLQGKHSIREQIWANAVGTGICCRMLSAYVNIGEGEAFLSGLLHDVGKLIMIRRDAKSYEKVLSLVGPGTKTFIEAEEEVFKLNHVDVGKWAAERWNFPESSVHSIVFHHNQWPNEQGERGKNSSPGMLVKAADVFSHAIGIGHTMAFRGFQSKAVGEIPHALQQLKIEIGQRETLLERFKKQFNEEYALYQPENL